MLRIGVKSFSYSKGIPADDAGHGGGFVFDCRSIENPGRLPEYKLKTGRSQSVIDFLSKRSDAQNFYGHVEALVLAAVDNYIARGKTSITANFGCTGGQHRSVFMAEKLAARLRVIPGVEVSLTHREFDSHPEWEDRN